MAHRRPGNEVLRKLGVFLLACAVGCGIMLLVALPLMLGIWWLLRYLAGQ